MMAESAALWFRDEGATDDCGEDDEDEGVYMFAQQTFTIWTLHVAREPTHVLGGLLFCSGEVEDGREFC